MKNVPLLGGPVAFVGALEIEQTATGFLPRRLPAWTRPQIPDLFMDVMVQMPSGVRLRFGTSATTIEIDVMLTLIRQLPKPLRAAVFDVGVDGEIVAQVSSREGTVITVSGTSDDVEFDMGEPTTVRIDGLRPGVKLVEVWLPQGTVVEVRELRVDDDATVTAAPEPDATRWVHYGSSISHCFEADTPTGTWPVVAARVAGVDIRNLGLAGQCMLDQFVARTIRDLEADVISVKVGINIVNGDTMRERTFGSAVHGFLDTVRDGHADTPLLVVSPIYCPPVEDKPGPTIMNAENRFVAVAGSEEIRVTCLSLQKIRATLAEIVDARRALGDANLYYLDGLELFGASDAADLPDDLHPNAAGYERMGRRFAQLVFGPGGPFATT